MQFESLLDHIRQKIELTPEEENIFTSKLKFRSYLKGQFIEQAGDISKSHNFIVKGSAKTFYIDSDGNEHIVAFAIEDWWIGDLCSITTQTPAEFHTKCLEETTVVHIPQQSMEELYVLIPSLERYFRLVIQKAYGNMSKRIVRNHAMPAKERYLYFIENYPEIVQRVPQYMIASYLGITKEFLSNIRKQLISEK